MQKLDTFLKQNQGHIVWVVLSFRSGNFLTISLGKESKKGERRKIFQGRVSKIG